KSLSESTRKFYKIDWGIFADWCNEFELLAMPAAPETVARFLVVQANSGIKPATLIRRLAAIRMAHEMTEYLSPTEHKCVKTVLKGIKNEKGVAQKKKAPATAERLESMIVHCDADTLIGLRDKALLLLG